MGILKSTASFLSIQPGEGRTTSLMMLHAFAMGTATVFFETAGSALFLAHFEARLLPYVYIGAAVVNTATGILYSGIQERVSFARLMIGTLVVLLLSTVGLRIGLSFGEAGWLMFALLIFYRVLSALTDLEYWAVATRLYDVRQAKRLFGLIGSGEVVARIVGSFSVPLLVPLLGVANLLVVSAAGLLGCLLLLTPLIGTAGASAREARNASRRKRVGGLGQIIRQVASPYLGLLLGITFFAILAKYFVDFAFLAEMRSRNADASHLASFFGIFSGTTQVLSLLTRLFLSGPLLDRFGIRVGLLILPLAHAACTLLLVFEGSVVGAMGAVFWLVIANQGIYKTLKHPIDNPSFKVLYQPLRAEERLAAQITVETIVTPLTTGLAGLIMLVFSKTLASNPIPFGYVMFVTFVGWVVVALKAGQAYPAALSEALKKRVLDNEDVVLTDPRSLDVIRERLASPHPAEVLFALDLFEASAPDAFEPLLVGLLEHPSPEVRGSVLARIERLRLASALPAVMRCVGSDSHSAVRVAALHCASALGGPAIQSQISGYLEDPDPQVSRAAFVGLVAQEKNVSESFASHHLRSLAASRKPEKRTWAAQVIADVGRRGFERLLIALLKDEAPAVRRAALVAAGKVRSPELWPTVAQSLADTRFAVLAERALVGGGDDALAVLETVWGKVKRPRTLSRIARIWGRVGGARAIKLLLKRMNHEDEFVSRTVIEALSACRYQAQGEDREAVESMIVSEAEEAAWELAALEDLADTPGSVASVRQALEAELDAARRVIFYLLSFLYDPTAILRALDNLRHESKERRAYALEILEVTLPRDMEKIVSALSEPLTSRQRLERLAVRFPQPRMRLEQRLGRIVERSDSHAWTRACACYAAGHLEAVELAETVASFSRSATDPLLVEVATWAARRIESGPQTQGRRAMLTVEKVLTLKLVPMFSHASEDVLADIAAIIEEEEVPAGKIIFNKGDVGDSMYIIVEGKVRVFDGLFNIAHLSDRDIFGELALLDPEPRVASIVAEEQTRLFRLDREAFSELMAGNIEIVRGVLRVLCERLRKAV